MLFRKAILILLLLVLLQAQVMPPRDNILSQFSLCNPSSNCCDSSTISVHGSATIQATPDMAIIQAQLKINAKTADQAVAALADNINRIASILASNGLTPDNYQTSGFSIYPNTSWVDQVAKVVGQIASQSLRIRIPSISKDGSNIGKLIDSLATVNGIILNSLSFDLTNKTATFQTARQQAFQNARTKAQDYAVALQLSLGQLLNLEDRINAAPVVPSAPFAKGLMMADNAGTSVNVGTIPVSYDLDAVFAFS